MSKTSVFSIIVLNTKKSIRKLGKEMFSLLLRDLKAQQVLAALQQHEPLEAHGYECAPLGPQDGRAPRQHLFQIKSAGLGSVVVPE